MLVTLLHVVGHCLTFISEVSLLETVSHNWNFFHQSLVIMFHLVIYNELRMVFSPKEVGSGGWGGGDSEEDYRGCVSRRTALVSDLVSRVFTRGQDLARPGHTEVGGWRADVKMANDKSKFANPLFRSRLLPSR